MDCHQKLTVPDAWSSPARVEMKAVETILHLRRTHPARVKNMVPKHVWKLVERYDLTPENDETR